MGVRSVILVFTSALNFRRLTHFWLCLLETQVNYFSYFLSMQETNRYLLIIEALNDLYKAMIVSRYLLVSCMLRKWLN